MSANTGTPRGMIQGGAYNFTTVGGDGGTLTQFTLAGLTPYTDYVVVLQAFNSRGAGPTSTPTVATTLEDSKYFVSYLINDICTLKSQDWNLEC